MTHIATENLYLTADKLKVIRVGDDEKLPEDAAFLLAMKGAAVPKEDVDKYDLDFDEPMSTRERTEVQLEEARAGNRREEALVLEVDLKRIDMEKDVVDAEREAIRNANADPEAKSTAEEEEENKAVKPAQTQNKAQNAPPENK